MSRRNNIERLKALAEEMKNKKPQPKPAAKEPVVVEAPKEDKMIPKKDKKKKKSKDQ